MTELLTLVALWCSVPSPYRMDENAVNRCREKALVCVQNNDDKHPEKLMECFKEVKLGQ